MFIHGVSVFLQRAEEAGEDYDQLKKLDTQADELDRMERKRKKKNPDPGFSGEWVCVCRCVWVWVWVCVCVCVCVYHHCSSIDYAAAQYRQYQRLTKQMEPDLAAYEKQKMEL